MNPILERYIQWMTAEIQLINTYHDHKEKMAWTATVFYVPAAVILGYTAANHLGNIAKLALSVLILIACVMTTMFVNMQFRKRWIAADRETGLRRIKARLCQLEEMPPAFDRSLPESEVNEGPPQWPSFVQQELKNCLTKRSCSDIPKAILNAIKFQWGKIDDRHKTEVPSYCAIAFATLIAGFGLWISACG
jgi:hypothetical protein